MHGISQHSLKSLEISPPTQDSNFKEQLMLSRQQKRKLARQSRSAKLDLEQLNSRVLLSVSSGIANTFALSDYDFSDIPADAPFDVDTYLDTFAHTLDDGYALPCVLSIDTEQINAAAGTGQFPGHPIGCTCPLCLGLQSLLQSNSDNADSQNDSSDSEADQFSQALASNSGSDYILYLDFDGETVHSRAGDFWLGSSSVEIPAFDLSSLGWQGREQEAIDAITEFIQEDYAPYDITITTEKPTSSEFTTIYIGGTNDWFRPGSNIIGLATYDPGNTDPSNFGFAFTEELGVYQQFCNGDLLKFSEYAANLISHEAAHTYGANHVSDTSALMNPYLPYSPNTSMFGSGTIPGTTSTQDTQSLLGSNLGYAQSSDDHGDDSQHATTVNPTNTINALLERRDDVDAFAFTPNTTGIMTIDIDTSDFGNLDSLLSVYQNTSLLAQNDNYGGNDSLVSFNVTAGLQYTVLIASANSNSSGTYALNLDAPDATPQIAITDSSGITNDQAIDFGNITVGDSAQATFTIANNGSANLVISTLTTSGVFQLDTISLQGPGSDDITIAPGANQIFTVTMAPDQIDDFLGNIQIITNDPQNSSATISLAGTGLVPLPDLVVTSGGQIVTDSIDFDKITRGQYFSQIVTVTNGGYATLNIDDIDIEGSFTLGEQFTTPITIGSGQYTQITICAPTDSRGLLEGQLTIQTNDPDSPTAILDLQSQVIGGVLTISETSGTPNDNDIDFGNVYIGDSPIQTITLTNTGDATLNIADLDITNSFTLEIPNDLQIEPNQSVVINLGYTPINIEQIEGSITITTDDTESPTSTVQLHAASQGGALGIIEADGVTDTIIDSGAIQLADDIYIPVWQLTNYTNNPMTVSFVVAGEELKLQSPDTITIQPHQTYSLQAQPNTALARQFTNTITLTAGTAGIITQSVDVSAQPYALIGQGKSYTFNDQTGDRVTVRLSGRSSAAVTLGDTGQPDIQSIQLLSDASQACLAVKVSGSGSTQLAQLTANSDLRAINASRVNIVGQGIDIEGSVKNITAASLQAEANISGSLRSLSLQNGDLLGSLNVDQNIGRINVHKGTIWGSVRAGATIGRITAGNILNADISAAIGIGKINVLEDMIDTNISIGDDNPSLNVSTPDGTYTQYFLDSINVSGTFSASTIAVGVNPDDDGNFETGTPTQITARVNAVKFTNIDIDNNNDPFGLFVGDSIKRLNLANKNVTPNYQENDFIAKILRS